MSPGIRGQPLLAAAALLHHHPYGVIYWSREGCTVRRGNCGGFLGVCALGLGLGILIAAVFPVGCLMFLVSFLLIACGIVCLRDRR